MTGKVAFKVWLSVLLAAALVGAFLLLESLRGSWIYGNATLHTIVEVVATLTSLIVGVLALVCYYARRDNTILLLSAGFIGTALLDGYHAVVTSTAVQPYFPSPDSSLIPWSWSASRVFLGLLMLCSWLAWRRERRLGASGQLSDIAVYAWVAMLTLISCLFFALLPLGPGYFPNAMFGRPQEFIAAALFAGALAGYWSKQEWRQDRLEYWIVNSLIVGLLCQALFMSRSYALFDGMFDMAHLLKIGSYCLVLTGLLAEIHATWESLRASEERFELCVLGTNDGIWDWNTNTDEVFYSDRFQQLLGFQKGELTHDLRSWRRLLHPDDLDSTMAAIAAHLEQRVPYDVEYRLRTRSGDYRWYRARGQAIWDESGKATRMAGSITDITERKNAESSLKDERFLFRTLLEHLPDAIYFKDTLGRFTRVSTSLARWLGAKGAEEMIGKTDEDFLPTEYAAAARADEQRLMETGQPMIRKEEHPQLDNRKDVWVSTTKVPLRDEHGAIVGTVGISHDITDQKIAQEKFRRVVEAAPNAMIVVNKSGRIQLVNAAAEQMFGYERGELIDELVEVLVPNNHRTDHVRRREDYSRRPVPRGMGPERELIGQRKDGGLFPIEIGLSPFDSDGETVVLSSIYDATKRKQAENSLVAAKEAAESANRAKSEFLANMSHEIRTPMNAIIGMTELVLETKTSRTQNDYLTIVLESAESLLDIINQVLDFSKIEAGRLELESIDFHLHEEVGDALKILGHRAHAKQLELAWHIDKEVPRYLRGDAARLRQVFVNLVGNAIKFTEQGEIVVDIRRQASDNSEVKLHCTVIDTGLGIPPSKQKHIFAAFEQADKSTTRQFGGTGLGLAISARIVEAMNGEMWVDSELGRGSRFHFNVNFVPGNVPAEAVDLQDADLADLPIVVVDDNETNRRILTEMLANWGMDVVTATTGPQAMELLENCVAEGKCPILLSDVHMPEMDGFMLAETLRANQRLTDTPIILLTSGAGPDDARRCEQLGIKIHLMKPAKQSELLAAISRAAGRTVAAKEVPSERVNQSALPSLKVLLVEDGKANQILAKGVLKKWGHHVDVAENGQEAIERWQQQAFDLILMDVQMPVMDGIEATRRIRALEVETDSHIPIVAMTAHAMKGDRDRCLQAGMDNYVAKPFRRHELYAVLYQLFSSTNQSSEETKHESKESLALLIDWQQALEMVDGDAEVLDDVVTAASQELPELIDTLELSISQGDLSTAQRAAHTIKSSSRILGAQQVVDFSAEAEEAAIADDSRRVEAAAKRLRGLITRISAEIDTFRENSKESS